mmetsp:Transcript_23220/g.34081  ORF Transcript_23220/g.34081 Transcript_23220/m.34081 type:complete len:186 (+) Transcript_23220:436-993(+)
MIKGLPAHTTEPSLYAVLAPYAPQNIRLILQRDTGECKGFAFIEFYSLEYAQYFMGMYAGSAGDMNAPQLIVENRAVTLEYARDIRGGSGGGDTDGQTGAPRREGGPKSDWLCDAVPTSCVQVQFVLPLMAELCSADVKTLRSGCSAIGVQHQSQLMLWRLRQILLPTRTQMWRLLVLLPLRLWR